MNDREKPLISVIIPTRERAETLFFAIQTALDQTSNDLEVIVSDNFSQDNTGEVVSNFSDRRLIYFNTNKRLSMCNNWDFATAAITPVTRDWIQAQVLSWRIYYTHRS